jgi:hypothetical protein
MNDTLQEWLAAGAITPGMLGCGALLPDRTCLSYSFNETYTREQLNNILHQLAETMASFASNGLASRRLTWTFEQGTVLLVARPDGLLLGLATQLNTEAAKNVDQLAKDFLALDLSH